MLLRSCSDIATGFSDLLAAAFRGNQYTGARSSTDAVRPPSLTGTGVSRLCRVDLQSTPGKLECSNSRNVNLAAFPAADDLGPQAEQVGDVEDPEPHGLADARELRADPKPAFDQRSGELSLLAANLFVIVQGLAASGAPMAMGENLDPPPSEVAFPGAKRLSLAARVLYTVPVPHLGSAADISRHVDELCDGSRSPATQAATAELSHRRTASGQEARRSYLPTHQVRA